MPDEPKKGKKSFAILAVALLCALVAAWFVLKSRKTPNMAPIAALRLDSIDETNRVATLSDGPPKANTRSQSGVSITSVLPAACRP
jgi:hypothetical protein